MVLVYWSTVLKIEIIFECKLIDLFSKAKTGSLVAQRGFVDRVANDLLIQMQINVWKIWERNQQIEKESVI